MLLALKKRMVVSNDYKTLTMTKSVVMNWGIRLVVIIYAIINLDAWLQVIAPTFFKEHIYKIGIRKIYNCIGVWVLLLIVVLLILHITRIFKIEKKVFWIMLILFLGNLLLMYLEIRKHGDS
jgi:hypothetical protein